MEKEIRTFKFLPSTCPDRADHHLMVECGTCGWRPTYAGYDRVNHPAHYTSDPSGVECIAIVRHRNFNVGCAMKYLWRAGLKDEDAHVEDLRKAIWYIEDEIKRLES